MYAGDSYSMLMANLEHRSMGDDRPARYVDGDVIVYRASGLGGCERALVATSQPDAYPPMPHPEWFQEVLDEGTAFEEEISHKWGLMTLTPTTGQQMPVELEVGEFENGLVVVRGHIDGQAGIGPRGREIKKIRESAWEKFLQTGIEYVSGWSWQVAAYMHATGWEWELIGGKLEGMKEAGNARISEVHGVVIAEPPIPFRAIHKKIARIEGLIAAGFDPKEAECQLRYPCPYWKLHDVAEEDVFEVPEGLRARVQELAHWVQTAGEVVKAGEEKKREAATELRELIEGLGTAAANAKRLTGIEGYRISRVRKVIPAHERKESTQDYWVIKSKEADDETE